MDKDPFKGVFVIDEQNRAVPMTKDFLMSLSNKDLLDLYLRIYVKYVVDKLSAYVT